MTKRWPKRRCSTSRGDPQVYLRHMLDHAQEAVDMVRGRDRGDLDKDRQLSLALVRLLEIIGAVKSKDSHPGTSCS